MSSTITCRRRHNIGAGWCVLATHFTTDPGPTYADQGHLRMPVWGEHHHCREVGSLRVADEGGGADDTGLSVVVRDNEAAYTLPPSTLGPNPVFQLVRRAVFRQ